jgi:hypothetical protein
LQKYSIREYERKVFVAGKIVGNLIPIIVVGIAHGAVARGVGGVSFVHDNVGEVTGKENICRRNRVFIPPKLHNVMEAVDGFLPRLKQTHH